MRGSRQATRLDGKSSAFGLGLTTQQCILCICYPHPVLPNLGPRALEVGAGPVDDGHEVVAEETDAASAEVGDRGLVLVDEGGPLWLAALLDRLVHGDALRHGPRQPAAFDERFACLDRIDRPHVANRDVVQRGDDAGGAGLLDVLQRDGVVRAVPVSRVLALVTRSVVMAASRAGTRDTVVVDLARLTSATLAP